MTETVRCYNFTFEVDGKYAAAFAEALYEHCDALSHFERPGDPTAPWKVEGFSGDHLDKTAVETAVSFDGISRWC